MASSSPLHRGDDDDDDDVNAEGGEVGDGARDRRSWNIILAANERRDEDLSFKLASGLSAPIQSVRLPRYIRTREKNTHTQEHHERARAQHKAPRAPSSPLVPHRRVSFPAPLFNTKYRTPPLRHRSKHSKQPCTSRSSYSPQSSHRHRHSSRLTGK